MSRRLWLVHDCLSHDPWLEFQGSPHDHAECRRLAAALYEARDAFRAATFDGSLGAAVAAELAWSAREAEWRPTLTALRRSGPAAVLARGDRRGRPRHPAIRGR